MSAYDCLSPEPPQQQRSHQSPRSPAEIETERVLTALRTHVNEHPLWDCALLLASDAGTLDRDDYRYLFGQYYLYSRNFTRYLAGLMAQCERDEFRAQLSANLWEEGGGLEPSRRHTQLLRNFLRDALGLGDPDQTEFADSTRHFVDRVFDGASAHGPLYGAAFLGLGVEGIVPRLYARWLGGLRRAGVAEEHLEFFKLHIACDDEHSQTLVDLMCAESARPGWAETCASAVADALTLRQRFFDALYASLRLQRLGPLLGHIQGRRSLANELPPGTSLRHSCRERGRLLHENTTLEQGICFHVDRLPLPGEVLDVRVVHIPSGKRNERHRHAHESMLYVIAGSGRVQVDDSTFAVAPGDAVLVPRWSLHHSENTGTGELTLLAVTDFGFASRAYLGHYDYRARKPAGSPPLPPPEVVHVPV